MNYWLDLFTPYTWTKFREHGAQISGFRPRQRNAAFFRVKRGDLLLCYLVKLSRWCGALEVVSDAFESTEPIFADESDPFIVRFKVVPKIILDFPYSIPIQESELWSRLSFTKQIEPGAFGWAQAARLRQSLVQISASDGRLIIEKLEQQEIAKKIYELDASDLRKIENRTVVRTEKGEVEVEVPDREEVAADVSQDPTEIRASIKFQAKIAELGIALNFSIWVPPSDRSKVRELLPENYREKLVTTLPLNYDSATLKTIENIDVIWLERRSIAHAFEVEHTTAIYSGLLRMADLLAMQPRMNIALHIVAPAERREQVRREIARPVFSVMEGGSMAERCSFIPYDAIDQILEQPNLSHMRESILSEFEEFFSP